MKHIILFVFLISSSLTFSQRLSNDEIKEFINQGSSEIDLPFRIPGTGITMVNIP